MSKPDALDRLPRWIKAVIIFAAGLVIGQALVKAVRLIGEAGGSDSAAVQTLDQLAVVQEQVRCLPPMF